MEGHLLGVCARSCISSLYSSIVSCRAPSRPPVTPSPQTAGVLALVTTTHFLARGAAEIRGIVSAHGPCFRSALRASARTAALLRPGLEETGEPSGQVRRCREERSPLASTRPRLPRLRPRGRHARRIHADHGPGRGSQSGSYGPSPPALLTRGTSSAQHDRADRGSSGRSLIDRRSLAHHPGQSSGPGWAEAAAAKCGVLGT